MQWKISINEATCTKKRVFLWGIEPPRLVVSQDSFQASLPNCSCFENKSNLLLQFSFCSPPFLPGILLEKKASLACTQSGTTSPSLPSHPILCIPSYQDIYLVASYTELYNCPWGYLWPGSVVPPRKHWNSSCDTSAQRWEWQHGLLCATPQEKLHSKFQFSWKSLSTAHKHLTQDWLTCQLHLRETQINHVLWGALHHTMDRCILAVWVLGSFWFIKFLV